ncbi:MAG: NUDIX domain-containing protein [Flavobacteriales bacterium]
MTFNLRVYALITNDKGEILLADEEYSGRQFTKFPGGGVEWGEGILDALKREAMEEMHQSLKNIEHFYTTDFFQKSAFHSDHQLISVYYTAKLSAPKELKISQFPFDFTHGKPSFRWINLAELVEDDLEFPIDKLVFKKLIS